MPCNTGDGEDIAPPVATSAARPTMKKGFFWRARRLLRRRTAPKLHNQGQSQQHLPISSTSTSLPIIITAPSLQCQSISQDASNGNISAVATTAERGHTVVASDTPNIPAVPATKLASSNSTSTRSTWRDKARSLFTRGGMTIEADNHVLFYQPASPELSDSHVKLTPLNHCHLCGASFDHQGLCLNCRHEICQGCAPLAQQKRKRGIYADSDEESGRGMSHVLPESLRKDFQLDRRVITNNLQIARTCHLCHNPFILFEKLCQVCRHLQCSKCPRSYPSSTQQLNIPMNSPPNYKLPERTYKRPKVRVKYTCEKCATLFQEKCNACAKCGHRRCPRCIRDPPSKHPPQMASIDGVAFRGLGFGSSCPSKKVTDGPSRLATCLTSRVPYSKRLIFPASTDRMLDLDVIDGLSTSYSHPLPEKSTEKSAPKHTVPGITPSGPQQTMSRSRPLLSAASLSLLEARVAQLDEEDVMDTFDSAGSTHEQNLELSDSDMIDALPFPVATNTSTNQSPEFSSSRLSLPFRPALRSASPK